MKIVIYSLFLMTTIVQVSKTKLIVGLTEEEKECVKQLGEDENRIQNLYFGYASPENDAQFNRFVECVWKKLGFITENGDINYENLKNSYQITGKLGIDDPVLSAHADKFVFQAVSKCESNPDSLKADSTAQMAVKIQNCISKNFNEAARLLYSPTK
ncbi:hypothetical protein ILUMI_06048 [Ignelater luminosus]|uniref:Uncharacterized protein n=1 Tax=Ignelater luminosus TaxID=2038154 RepID=A0A8K0DGE5_IGNLU|nr:hypothetical protein ILUMI_06048 [Ignelater luminosus]